MASKDEQGSTTVTATGIAAGFGRAVGIGRAISGVTATASVAGENLNRLAEDVRRQQDLARAALDLARRLGEIARETNDQALKQRLEATKMDSIAIARELTANSSHTAASVQSTFDLIENLTKK